MTPPPPARTGRAREDLLAVVTVGLAGWSTAAWAWLWGAPAAAPPAALLVAAATALALGEALRGRRAGALAVALVAASVAKSLDAPSPWTWAPTLAGLAAAAEGPRGLGLFALGFAPLGLAAALSRPTAGAWRVATRVAGAAGAGLALEGPGGGLVSWALLALVVESASHAVRGAEPAGGTEPTGGEAARLDAPTCAPPADAAPGLHAVRREDAGGRRRLARAVSPLALGAAVAGLAAAVDSGPAAAPRVVAHAEAIRAAQESHRDRAGVYARSLGELPLPPALAGGYVDGHVVRFARLAPDRWVACFDPIPWRPGLAFARAGPDGLEAARSPLPLE